MCASAAVLVLAAAAQSAAWAQSAAGAGQGFGPAAGEAAPLVPAAAPAATVAEVVVTGSRIPQPNLTSVSPVVSVGGEEFKLEGASRVEDLLNTLPQVYAAQSANVGNGATGTATVDLRDLGPSRTLVLIDGRRVAPGDPQTGSGVYGYAPDLNLIPAALIDHVEVLTGGASAVYGSDAVAGVVNFVMQKDFQGVKLDASGGFYVADNNNTPLQGLERAAGVSYPSGTTADGGQEDVTAVFGLNTPDGRGNVMAYAGYRNQDAVYQDQRDYSACQFQEAGSGFACSGSPITSPAHIYPFTPFGQQLGPANGYVVADAAGNVAPYTNANAYNFAPFNLYQRPDTRYTAGAFAHYDISPSLNLYGQFMFMDDQTQYAAAPSGIFGQLFEIPCASPLLSASEVSAFCTAGGLGPSDPTVLALAERDVEGGPRYADFRHDDYRLVTGARGDLGANWSYDAYVQYSRVDYSDHYSGEFSVSRTANALDVAVDTRPTLASGAANPAYGTIQCEVAISGADPACVPYNIFQTGQVTPAAIAYLMEPAVQTGSTDEEVASANLTGQLGAYGFRSPLATDGLGVNLGAEYRRDGLTLVNDQAFLSGDLAGLGAERANVDASEHVYELFGEVLAPLVQDRPFVRALTADLGYRFSDYDTVGTTNTFKLGGDWSVTGDLRLRASFNHAIRAPNVQELFTPGVLNIDGSTDPCAGPDPAAANPNATLANCERTGVTPAQYGAIAPNPAAEYSGLGGGNPDLKPETANTLTYGLVFTPAAVPGLTASVDYYDITVHDIIGPVGADTILNACVNADDFCNLIHRAPGTGSLWLGETGYVVDTDQNSGYLETKGVDVALDYRMALPEWRGRPMGGLSVSLAGTYLSTYVDQPIAGLGAFNCAGRFGPICGAVGDGQGDPLPRWRHKLRLTWSLPAPVELSAQWRFISPVEAETQAANTFLAGQTFPADARIGVYSYIDLTAVWRVRPGLSLRAGVNNVADVQPPTVGSGVGGALAGYNGDTYPGVYDALGRYVFMGLTAAF